MDGLALLCNLFADGPVTLKRLRLSRIAHLAELERTEPAQLAALLHASVPQARAFAEEARKLARRLAEEQPRLAPTLPARSEARQAARTERSAEIPAETPVHAAPPPVDAAPAADAPASLQAIPLVPGLLPGLDEALCARLHPHQVRTVQALSEFAGLSLARRTGIPYSTLLALAREGRRLASERARALSAAPAPRSRAAAPSEPVRELLPFLPAPRRAPAERELTGSDAFTLPQIEPESAGPFG
jgi:hypothetical protein